MMKKQKTQCFEEELQVYIGFRNTVTLCQVYLKVGSFKYKPKLD